MAKSTRRRQHQTEEGDNKGLPQTEETEENQELDKLKAAADDSSEKAVIRRKSTRGEPAGREGGHVRPKRRTRR